MTEITQILPKFSQSTERGDAPLLINEVNKLINLPDNKTLSPLRKGTLLTITHDHRFGNSKLNICKSNPVICKENNTT